MQTQSRHLPLLFLTTTMLVSFSIGCASQSSPTPQQFADQYKALMTSYRSQMRMLTSRPIPRETVPKNKKRYDALLAQSIDDVANANTEYATKLAALQAPASMMEVKSTTKTLLEVTADDNHRIAQAMRQGDEKTIDQVSQQGQVNELAATKNVQLAFKRIGVTSPKLQSLVDKQQGPVNK